MTVQVFLALDSVDLSDAERAVLHDHLAEWVIVKDNGSRRLVHALVDPASLPFLESMLAIYNPVVIGLWDEDGSAYEDTPVQLAQYLELDPDGEVDNQFAGWGFPHLA